MGSSWLKPPQIIFALGSPNDGQSIARAFVHKMRDGKLSDDELKDPLFTGIVEAKPSQIKQIVGKLVDDLGDFGFRNKLSQKAESIH